MEPVTPNGHYTGHNPDRLDPRDIPFQRRQRVRRVTALPALTHNRLHMPKILNQGNLGSCTANSSSGVLDYHRIRQGLPPLAGSRLAQYYNTRVLEGTVNSDSGASIRNTIKAMNRWGMAPETLWPYEIAKFRERPPDVVYVESQKNQVLAYYRLTPTREEIMEALAEELVLMFGFLVFSQFDNLPATGILEMPRPGEQPLGGHSQVAVDYETRPNGQLMFPTWNTWGDEFGDDGWAYFPESFLLNPQYCQDFWAVETIEREDPPAPPPTPTPDPPPHVGDDIKRIMDQYGDVPLHREGYSVNERGENVGWSLIHAWNPATDGYFEYKYILSTPRRITRTYIPRNEVYVL